ncbi:DUF177 domain-containing protein [bacterium]|nr:DUF177 domain-containing protein [bacterium]
MMNIIISEIENKDNKRQQISFSETIEEFNTQVPVVANFDVSITGQIIRIRGNIHAEVNLVCDVCLKEFTKIFDIEVDEAYTKGCLNDSYSKELELKEDGFIEDLNGKNEIDITDFVYQCVILNVPNKLVCDINCKGDENINKYIKKEIPDPRLEIFKTIKIEKDK